MPGTPNSDLIDPNADARNTANEYARELLRHKNVNEFKSDVQLNGKMFWPNGAPIESGVVIAIANKGHFDGNWLIHRTVISINDAKLTMDINLRKCIPEYQSSADSFDGQPAENNDDPDPDPPSDTQGGG